LGCQPGCARAAYADVAVSGDRRARPARFRPGSGTAGHRRGVLPGRASAPSAAYGTPVPARREDLRRQGPATLRGGVGQDLAADERPGEGTGRATGGRASGSCGVPDDQGPAAGQGADRLESEQRGEDDRGTLLAACQIATDCVDPGE